MAEKSCGSDFLAGFVVGALVGAAAALILAPQSGEDTRTLIRDKGIELKGQAGGVTAEARKRAEELGELAKDRAETLQTQIKQAIEEGRTAASQKKEDLLTELEEGRAATEEEAEE